MSPDSGSPPPPPVRFWLTLWPESAQQPWQARLAPDDPAGGEPREFGSPIELLRYLVQQAQPGPPATGGLK